jgi:hypothetical protein
MSSWVQSAQGSNGESRCSSDSMIRVKVISSNCYVEPTSGNGAALCVCLFAFIRFPVPV